MNCLVLLLLLACGGSQCGGYGRDGRNGRDGDCGCGRDGRDDDCGCGRDGRNGRDSRDDDCGCGRDGRDGRRDGRCDGDRPAAWDSDCGCNGQRQGFPGLNRSDTCGCES